MKKKKNQKKRKKQKKKKKEKKKTAYIVNKLSVSNSYQTFNHVIYSF